MNLILLEPHEITGIGDARLSGVRARHVIDILKSGPGDRLRIGVIDGPYGEATVQSLGAGRVDVRCSFDQGVPLRPRVDLLLALPRPKVMRRLWAQIAALGVGQVILTNADRVERFYFDSHVLAPACYRPLLIEGLQQARDTRLPRVSIHRQFKVLVEDDLDAAFDGGLRLVADPLAPATAESVIRSRHPAESERALIAIGPEGGWNGYEKGLLERHGFGPIGLGTRVLRSDTACVVLLALVHQALSADGAAG